MSQFTQNLLAWYTIHKRKFPWRENINVYHTWICEIMSQQTTISVVLPRFKKFISELPNLNLLAECSDEKLRELWAGLGYYARARNLRIGAKYIIEEHNSDFPKKRDDWLKVPGCGHYTASIISSICFNERVACVDGNVIRVVSRLLNLQSNVWNRQGQNQILSFVTHKISDNNPGDFNQAMMDLGAMVCKKSNPNCFECPVNKFCLAYKNNSVSLCPPVKPRKTTQLESVFVFVFKNTSRLEYSLVERKNGLLSNTKGFPLVCSRDGFSLQDLLLKFKKFGLAANYLENNFKHLITHHKITGHVILIEDANPKLLKDLFKELSFSQSEEWISLPNLKQNLSSSLDLKVLKILSSI
ncbi:hypothetical protein [Spirobacillus cienkowskii]|jgi:A/G-specific adenine glycosylase